VWQLTAIDTASSFVCAELVVCKQGNPTGQQVSKLARQVAAEVKAAGWRLERVFCDSGQEFKSERFGATLDRLQARRIHIRTGRPQTSGHVEALHKTISTNAGDRRSPAPRFSGLRPDLELYLSYYNFERVHMGRLTHGRAPADIVYGAQRQEGEMSRKCRHNPGGPSSLSHAERGAPPAEGREREAADGAEDPGRSSGLLREGERHPVGESSR
jgi:hypothetical protein